jgi:hypothetical protein
LVSSSLTSLNLTTVFLKLVTEFVGLYFTAPDFYNFKIIIIIIIRRRRRRRRRRRSTTRTLKQPYRIHNTGASCQNVRQLANKMPCFMESKLRFRTNECLPHNKTRRQLHLDHDFTTHFPTFLFNFVRPLTPAYHKWPLPFNS